MEFVLGHNLLLVLGFAVLPSVLGVLILLPMHETPKFLLCFRHDRPAAIRSIRFYHGRDANCEEVLEAVVKESEQETHSQSSYWELLTTPHLRKGVLLGITALQQTTALWVIFFQSIFFLEQVDIDAHWAGWASTAMVFFYTIGSALGSSFVDRWGRRNLLLPFAAASLCLLLLFVVCAVLHPIAPFANYGCVASLWLYTFIYGFGCGPICWYLVAELAPQMHRSRVQVVCYFTNMVISGAIMFALMPLFKLVGYSAFLPLYVLPGFVSLAVLYAKLPETRGREIHEIVAELKGTKNGDLLKESS
ncbi:MFS domain-containing protein [Aphelenchoides fujianensis]|nr:MFS domain-containing protein [Aphelenchoides fujianensis]